MGTDLVEQLAGDKDTFPVVLLANPADIPKAVKSGADFVCGQLTVEALRLVLQASVAALVNVQSVEAVDAELKRRAISGN